MTVPRAIAVLIERYLDDDLDAEGRASLARHLREDPLLADAFAAQLDLERALADAHGGDDFTARVLRRLEAGPSASGRRRPAGERPRRGHSQARLPRAERLGWRLGIPLAACLVLGAVLALRAWPTTPGAATVVAAERGTLQRTGRALPLVAGMEVLTGDTIEASGGDVLVGYADATRIRIHPDASVGFADGTGKRLRLDRGGLTAEVSVQPAYQPLRILTPQAEAVVVGTVFHLSAGQERTRLAVDRGHVRLLSRRDPTQALDVRAGRAAVADATGLAWETPAAPAQPPEVLLVHRSPADDPLVAARLARHGLRVVERTDLEVTAADAIGKALVVVSENASVDALGGRLRPVACPMIVWECGIYDLLGMAAHQGMAASGRTVLIARPGHPLAAGLRGEVIVARTDHPLSIAAERDILASSVIAAGPAVGKRRESSVAVFAYDRGERLPGGEAAPGRRVGFFLAGNLERDLTPDGWALFDAAVAWCLQAASPLRQ
jgi:ferric-dicitrate binding protein FerR (iron transport regulator)